MRKPFTLIHRKLSEELHKKQGDYDKLSEEVRYCSYKAILCQAHSAYMYVCL